MILIIPVQLIVLNLIIYRERYLEYYRVYSGNGTIAIGIWKAENSKQRYMQLREHFNRYM